MQRPPVEFFTGADKDAYWRVMNSDGNQVNRSSEGFRHLGSAKNNLLIFHTLLSMDLLALSKYHPAYKGINQLSNLQFYEDENGQCRWRVKANNQEIVGASHIGFSDIGKAKDNVFMTYSLISIYIASLVTQS